MEKEINAIKKYTHTHTKHSWRSQLGRKERLFVEEVTFEPSV